MSRPSQANPSKEYISKEQRKKIIEERGKQANVEDVESLALSDLQTRLVVAKAWGFTEDEAVEAIRLAIKAFLKEYP